MVPSAVLGGALQLTFCVGIGIVIGICEIVADKIDRGEDLPEEQDQED